MTVILIATIGLVGMGIYDVWQGNAPTFDVMKGTTKVGRGARAALTETPSTPGVSTRTIVARNLFDPDRGAKTVKPPAPAKVSEEPEQSIDGVLLLGTVIAGTDRYAIMKVPPDLGPVSRKLRRGARTSAKRATSLKGSSEAGVRRVRVGDSLRGYRVEDIEEQKVVLKKGTAKTEVSIDYTREVIVPPKRKPRSKARAKKSERKRRSRKNRSRTPQKR